MLTRTAFALLLTLAGVGETQAAGRIYCAVDDAYIKMSLESGFDAAGGNKLIHFRGALTLKDSKVPGLIETMLLKLGNAAAALDGRKGPSPACLFRNEWCWTLRGA